MVFLKIDKFQILKNNNMKKSEIEKIIVSKTILDYSVFDKVIVSLRDISFVTDYEGNQLPSYVLQSIYYDLDNSIINKETKLNHLISNEIKELLLEVSKTKKINKGTLTIYPGGEYESSFIWDNEAHLGYLVDGIYSLIGTVYEELNYKIRELLPAGTPIDWRYISIIIPFIKGKIQPLEIIIKGEKIVILSLLIENITYEETPEFVQWFEDVYQLTNEGELKGQLSEKWNKLHLVWTKETGLDLSKDVLFEWVESLA